jgi:hypothetical protein
MMAFLCIGSCFLMTTVFRLGRNGQRGREAESRESGECNSEFAHCSILLLLCHDNPGPEFIVPFTGGRSRRRELGVMVYG